MGALGAAALVLALFGCAPQPPPGDPPLWLLQDEDTRIWLFATVHVLAAEANWRSPELATALAEAETIILETPVDAQAERAVAAAVQAQGLLPASLSLSDLLAPAEAERLRRQARRLRLDSAGLERLRPWLAALQLTLAQARALGRNAETGVEETLARQAAAQGRALRYLETPEQQVAAMAGLSRAAELGFLRATLDQLDREPDALARLDALWLAGDREGLAAALEQELSAAGPELRAALIDRRNRAWSAQIEGLLDEPGDMLVAVGAAHLLGEGSVIDLLRRRGLEVEPQ